MHKFGSCCLLFSLSLAVISGCNLLTDAAGNTVAVGGTTYYSRFIDTPKTYIVDKPAGTALAIEIERGNGNSVIKT